MTVYLDTSALVPLFEEEKNSSRVREWFRNQVDTLIVGDLARIEFSAVISRAFRMKRYDRAQAERRLNAFDQLRHVCDGLTHDTRHFALADELLRDFSTKLAGPDALHLASAIIANAAIFTLDARLSAAAMTRGIETITLA